MTHYECPVCGYDRLVDPPSNYNICPCCGTEFEADDFNREHSELRGDWIEKGMPWFSRSTLQPRNWNAYRQLIRAGFGADLVIHHRMNDDIDFRYEVNKAFSEVDISKQLRALREREGTRLTQAQLAARTDMKQSRISELEGMDYSSWSISTLERLAKGLGVAFYYSFITWDELASRIKGTSAPRTARPIASNLESVFSARSAGFAATTRIWSASTHSRERTPIQALTVADEQQQQQQQLSQRQLEEAASLSYRSPLTTIG